MPSPTEIYQSKRSKFLLYFLVCIALTAGGIWMVKSPGYKHPDKDRVMGVLCVLMFGAGGILCGLQLLPNRLRLQIGPDGFSARTLFWTANFYRWTDIEKFGVAEFTIIGGGRSAPPTVVKGLVSGGMQCRRVAFNFSPTYPGGGPAWRFKDFNRKTYGFDGVLEEYDTDCDHLVAHLNQLREQDAAKAK